MIMADLSTYSAGYLALILNEARAAKLKWEKREKEIAAELWGRCGLDSAPSGEVVEDAGGNPVLQVQIIPGLRLDQKILKAKFPDVYAQCQVPTQTRKLVKPT